MRLRRRKVAVLGDLSRPRLGVVAERYAAEQSRPKTGLVTVLGAVGLSADYSQRQERFADDLFEFGAVLSRAQGPVTK